MINYRLLRDNKESGPYSEEELIAKGFKPYDLLWAEGRSAGWQYPSEIASFKKHAPIVEEQPYDRFYKKQPAQKTTAAENRNSYSGYSHYQSNAVKENKQSKETISPVQPVAKPAYEYNLNGLPARHIHVTLPSGNTVNLTTLVSKKENKEPIDNAGNNATGKKQIPLHTDEQAPAFLAEPVAKSLNTVARPMPAITAVSTDNSGYANIIPQPGFSWTLLSGAVIGIATMVGLGIMIGLSINREKSETAFNNALAQKTKQVQQPVTQALSNNLPVVPAAVVNDASTLKQAVPKKELVQHAVIKTQAETVKEKSLTAADKPVLEKTPIIQNTDLSLQHINTSAASVAAAIGKKLSLQENDFTTGAFGGISNLKLTLVNSSALPVESVQVEIDYILANKKIYKTETVLFKEIAAGAQATVDAPASSRGVRISSRVTKINAKDAGLNGNAATVKS
jgi:hypothetical protein